MNLSDVWNSPRNAPTAVEREALVQHARDTIRRALRRRVAFLAWTASALSAVTAWAVYSTTSGRAVLGGAWPLLLILAAQWAVFFHFLRQTLADGRKTVARDATIRESLERLQREAEADRRGLIVVLALFAVVAPLMAAAILELREAGKMAAHEAASAGMLFAATGVASATLILVRLYRTVLPRRRRLEMLLQQYGDPRPDSAR